MYARKIKRKCSVRGCKNTGDVFVISRNREMGNSIAICRACMTEGLEATEHYSEPVKKKTEKRPLFYHPELESTPSVTEKEPKPQEVIEDTEVKHNTVAGGVDSIEESPADEPDSLEKPSPKPTKTTRTTAKNTAKKRGDAK